MGQMQGAGAGFANLQSGIAQFQQHASMLGQPPRPLFPAAAAAVAMGSTATSVSNDIKSGSLSASGAAPSSKSLFPAYSSKADNGTSEIKTDSKASVPLVVPPGAGSKIIHPPEDISLEQKRAMLPKYANPKISAHSISAPPMLHGGSSTGSSNTIVGQPTSNVSFPQVGGNQFRHPSVGLPANPMRFGGPTSENFHQPGIMGHSRF